MLGRQQKPPVVHDRALRAVRVLLAEDVDDNRELARELLAAAGWEVVEARNGQECLDKARGGVDLILLDLSLPVVDGWEALRRLREDGALGRIPVIAVTAHAMAGDRERAMAAGCSGYIPKPIAVASFASEVEAILVSSAGRCGNRESRARP